MAKTDSRTKIRPDLIKTPLHHLVVIKKKIGMTAKRLTERSRDYGGFTLLVKILVTRRRKREQDRPIFSSYLERLLFDYSSSDEELLKIISQEFKSISWRKTKSSHGVKNSQLKVKIIQKPKYLHKTWTSTEASLPKTPHPESFFFSSSTRFKPQCITETSH